MTTMDQIKNIRDLFYKQGMNISEISSETGLNWKTVKKYVDLEDFNPPAEKPASQFRFCPKLDPYKPIINDWLEQDKKAPRKQRHTAKRVYQRLKKEVKGFDCSYRLVADYVSYMKEELNLKKPEGFLPLIHHAGEAQGDFGSASFYENGKYHEGKYLCLSFPYSNQGFPQLNYGENMECLLEGLDAIFRHIGGVPKEIWLDNASTMVTKIIKDGGRTINKQFQRFSIHYGFDPVFMNPDSGHEKGNVEGKVGYCRRNFLVPVPSFENLDEYNRVLFKEADEDADRDHYKFEGTHKERFRVDQKHLLPLPTIPFNLTGVKTVPTDAWGKFKLNHGKHEYSSSPKHANKHVHLRLTSKFVTVLDADFKEIVTHRRLYGDEKQESIGWIQYLEYISRHPRSLKNTGIYDMMPDVMKTYLHNASHSDRKQLLKILAELTERTGFDSAVRTVKQAVLYQATDVDSVMNLYRGLYSDIPELPPLQPQDDIPHLDTIPVDLSFYDKLLDSREEGILH